MRIDEALNRAAGIKELAARRACWPWGVYLVINRGQKIHEGAHLLIFTDDGQNVRAPYAATTDDICANDWEVW